MNDEYIIHCDCGAEAEYSEWFLEEGTVSFFCRECFLFSGGDVWCALNWTVHILEES